MSDHEVPSDIERELGKLDPHVPVPAHLEDQVVHSLAQQGLIKPTHPSRFGGVSMWKRSAALAAGLAVFALGTIVGRTTGDPTFPRGQFMLLLYEGPEYEMTTDDNFSSRFQDYNQWIAELRANGNFVTGEQLDSTGMIVVPPSNTGQTVVVEGRKSTSEDGILGSMFLIAAASYDEALAIARSAPHVRYGGRVGVRRITPI